MWPPYRPWRSSLPDRQQLCRPVQLTSFRAQTTLKNVIMEGFAAKVAVVTGAGSGIGQDLAIELGRSGASVAISDVDTEGLART